MDYLWIAKTEDTRHTPVFITYFTIVHFLTGAFFYHLLAKTTSWPLSVSFFVWSIVHLIYEWKDVWTSYIVQWEGYAFEHSLFNGIGDHVFALAGFLFAWTYRRTISPEQTAMPLMIFLTIGVFYQLE